MQIYNQFIKLCESLMGLITTQMLLIGAAAAIGLLFVLTAIVNRASASRKFYNKCYKLERFLRKNKLGYENMNDLDKYCKKISRGCIYGWNKFKKSRDKKPSDFLTKKDVLDAKVSDANMGGGRAFLKTYIGITSLLLFILNVALIGRGLPFDFDILVEAMLLPFVYYVASTIVYALSTLVKRHHYVSAVSHFYSMIDKLDKCFETAQEEQNLKAEKSAEAAAQALQAVGDALAVVDETLEKIGEENQTESKIEDENIETTEENQELDMSLNDSTHEDAENVSEDEIVAENEEANLDETEEVEEVLDNAEPNETDIEEETIESEESENQESAEQEVEGEALDLSAFEINEPKQVGEEQLEEILAENEETTEEANEEVAEEATEKISETPAEAEENEEINEETVKPVARDWEAEQNLDYYDVFKKKNINIDKYINEIPNEGDGNLIIEQDQGFVPTDELVGSESNSSDEETEEEVVEIDLSIDENESLEEENDEIEDIDAKEEVEETQEAIEEITEQEPVEVDDFQPESQDEVVEEKPVEPADEIQDEANQLETDIIEDSETIEPEEIENEEQKNEFKAQLAQNLNESTKEIDDKLEDDKTASIDLSALVGEFKQNQENDELVENESDNDDKEEKQEAKEPVIEGDAAEKLVAKINDLENLINTAINKQEGKTEKSSKSKNAKRGKSKMTTENEKKTRGRPKMQTIDENLVINTEEEFEEILSRAEKLMRKSEQGLSASQSKRIEKELKIMMDAMNKYKEGK